MRWSASIMAAAVLLFVMLSGGEHALAIDPPHNGRNSIDMTISCSTCHFDTTGPTPSWVTQPTTTDETYYNNLCTSCHVPSKMPDANYIVKTHSSSNTSSKYPGGWTVECRTCHNPHYQDQVSSYPIDTTANLADGTIVSCVQLPATSTEMTVTVNAAGGLSANAWIGHILIPNIVYPTKMYHIRSNTSNVITVSGAINCRYASAGSTFAIRTGTMVAGQVKTPGGTPATVKFFSNDPSKLHSYGSSTDPATVTGICQVCHTRTTSFNRTNVTGSIQEGPGHPKVIANGQTCTACHMHTEGLKADCITFHGLPPVVAAQNSGGVTNGMVNNEGGTGSSTPGAHGKHAALPMYSCPACHGSGMPASAIYDKKIQIGFSIANGAYESGRYDGRTTLANGFSYTAGNAGTSVTQNGTMTCSDLYCHSDGTSVATGTVPSIASPNWTTGTTLCDSCHGYPPGYASGSPKPNSHGNHNYTCDNCHSATTTNGTVVTGPANHVNAAYDLQPGPGRSFSYSFAYPNGTCSTVSCHGNTGTQWGASACMGCHAVSQGSRAAIAPQFGGNSHHVQGTAVSGVHCYQCHWEANSDGSIHAAYHGGSAAPGAPVNLVVFQAGSRPTAYTPGSTAVPYTADGSRAQIANITPHCLGCHSDQNNDTTPFVNDGKTPKHYAWDGTSVDARFSSSATTSWGKYSGANTSPKNTLRKAFSAHGNAGANQGGWDLNETWPNTRNGSVNVACFDCHNSHGSTAAGITTRYTSSTMNGGILKDTKENLGGYTVNYTPVSGGTATDKNLRSAGASLCLDCHLTQSAGTNPWGYGDTFGATNAIIGYWDSPYLAPGDVGAQKRYPYKSIQHNAGGHFGRSSELKSPPDASHQINGLCTACHDPHGVSPTLGANQKYGVPMLKGTWVSSPYKEDVAPVVNGSQLALSGFLGGYIGYHIDQNTFGSDILGAAPNAIIEQDTEFAGLCLGCHPKSSLTTATTPAAPNAWKSKDRIHEAVNGWKTSSGTVKHNYTCSKCHSSHNGSVLPRLMTTNCLNGTHKGRTASNPAPVIAGSSGGSGDYGSGSGSGRIPGSYFGSGSGDDCCGGPNAGNHLVSCHEGPNNSAEGTDQRWNEVTPWTAMDLAPPTLVDEPNTGCSGSCSTQLNWWPAINPDGHAVQYNLQVDDAPDFSSPDHASGWISGTSWTVSLSTQKTWYWRVQERDAVHTAIESGWSVPDAFTLAQISPPAAPMPIDATDSPCTGSCAVSLQWNAVTVPDGDPARYSVQISTVSNFGTLYSSSGYLSGTSISAYLPTGNTWYWRVMTIDSVHSVVTSSWSTVDTFRMALPPAAPALLTQPSSTCASSCAKTLQWNASTGPFGDPLEYFVEVDDAQDFLTPVFNNAGAWVSGTSLTTSALATNKVYYWRVKARDANNTVFLSPWSLMGMFVLSTGSAPAAPTLASPPNSAYVPSDTSLQWNAIPLAEYLVSYSTDSTFNTGVVTSGWISGTSWYPAPGPAPYYWKVQARNVASQATGPWSSTWSFTITDGCYGDPCCLYGCSTCPTLYAWDGVKYAFETDTFPTGFLGTKTATGWRKPNPYEYHLLENAPQLLGGQYSLKIVEERDEHDYFDTLKLYAVDYPLDRDIYQELRTAGIYVPPAQMIHTVDKTLKKPVSITHVNTGENISAKLADSDEDYHVLNTDRNLDFNWQTLEIDLGDQSSAPQIKLIIDAEMVVPTTSAGMARKTLLSPNGKITRLEVLDVNGNWTLVPASVKEIFSPKERSSAYIVDITNIFTTSVYKFRLSFLYKIYVDAMYFDTTVDVPVTLAELPLISATLWYYGYSQKTEGELFDYIYGDLVSRDTTYFTGSYTKYGEVTPLLMETDDKFVIFAGGDEVDARFSADGTPPAGKARRYLVYANGYYKATGNVDIPHTVEPLPFKAMSNYPYDPAVENYPADADHNLYRTDYNTRTY